MRPRSSSVEWSCLKFEGDGWVLLLRGVSGDVLSSHKALKPFGFRGLGFRD